MGPGQLRRRYCRCAAAGGILFIAVVRLMLNNFILDLVRFKTNHSTFVLYGHKSIYMKIYIYIYIYTRVYL